MYVYVLEAFPSPPPPNEWYPHLPLATRLESKGQRADVGGSLNHPTIPIP